MGNLPSQLAKGKDVTGHIRAPALDNQGNDSVDMPSTQYRVLNERWKMTNALIEGTGAMRTEAEKFLPAEPAESKDAYDIRLARSVLFAAYKKTCTTSTGRPFSRPITFEGYSAKLLDLNKNIDLQGNSIDVFARHVFFDGLAHGHAFVFVDHTARPVDAPTLEDERVNDLRPFWRKIRASDIIGWQSESRGGKEYPIQVRIREEEAVPDGDYGEKVRHRVRVLKLGGFELFEQNDKGAWARIDDGQFLKADGTVLDKIPLVPFYSTLPTALYVTTPTLLDLAYMNVLHWQSQSDQENIVHVARVPILFGSGFYDGDTIQIGSSRWIKGPSDSKLAYVEHSGAAIQAGRDALTDLENRMRIMGAEILVRDPARVTATQKVIDSDEATSELQDMVTRYQDFLQQCYTITAEWLGEDEASVGTATIYKDFGLSAASFQEATTLLQSRLAKQITQETYLQEIKRRGLLGDDVDVEIEVQLTEAEGPDEDDENDDDYGKD